MVSVVPSTDQMGVSFGPTRERLMPVQHPFIGTAHWIRSMPDPGTRLLMQNRFDSQQPEAIKTLPIASQQKSQAYLEGTSLYRTLEPGEHDIMSSGAAAFYMGRRGHADLRSGASVKRQLSREAQQTLDHAPTHIRTGLNWTAGRMGDEDRFGIVKRPTSPIQESYPRANDAFQGESFRKLLNPAGTAPAVLFRTIEGQVYEEDGTRARHFTTNIPLRRQELHYTTTDDFVRHEIDENGNHLTILPITASTGMELLIPNGHYNAQIGLNRDITVLQDDLLQVARNQRSTVGGKVNWDITGNLNFVVGQNALTMDVTEGEETVGLVNAQLLGFQAENTADGGLTSIFGPNGSGVFLNGLGKVQIQDGAGGGGMAFEGTNVSAWNQDGARLALSGTAAVLSSSTGSDMISIDSDLVQILTGDAFSVVGNVFNAKVGTCFLGNNAAIPAVLGLTFLGWVDSHAHLSTPTGTPTSPPLIPASSLIGTPASLLSLSAFFSSNI